MNKLPIKKVREEIRLLQILLDLEIIGRIAQAEFSKPSEKQIELEQKIEQLKRDYPKWTK